MKRTDTQRLNYLEKLHKKNAPQDWIGIHYDGTIILDEPSVLDSQYDLSSNARPTIRQAVDAAMDYDERKK